MSGKVGEQVRDLARHIPRMATLTLCVQIDVLLVASVQIPSVMPCLLVVADSVGRTATGPLADPVWRTVRRIPKNAVACDARFTGAVNAESSSPL